MDLLELNALSLEGAKGATLPVPDALMETVSAHPEEFGLPQGISRRKGLALLLLRGARDAQFEHRAREREDVYRRLHADPEWQQAADEAYAEVREGGRF